MVDDYAFVSASLKFTTLAFDMLQYLQVPICGEYITEDENNENECPGDGIYDFNIPYVLPNQETAATWLVSGWSGAGEVTFFSEANNIGSLIGSCKLRFTTAVTQSTTNPVLSKVPFPSALITAIVLVAFVAFLVLTCLFRMCRDYAMGKKTKKAIRGDDDTHAGTAFTAMSD